MKLTDLEPRWFCQGSQDNVIGITFACPHCPGTGNRLAIALHLDGTNMDPDPENPQQFSTDERVWTVASGSGFGDVTLTPSVDASKSGHWHGFITDGEIR